MRAARFTPYAVAIFVVALALRAFHLFELRASPFLIAKLGDAAAYDAWARELAAGDWLGSQVFYQAPLYPYLLGALYATVGDSPLVVRGVQCGLSALACALLASAGARLFSRGVGVAAGLLLATHAPSIFLDVLLQKSVLDLLFVSLALWLAARLADAPSSAGAAALGLASGLLALARENALVVAAVLAAWLLLLPNVERRRRIGLALVFVAGVGAALLPVALRNAWVGGELHLTTSQLGPNLYIGNHAGAPGGYEPLRPGRGSAEFERIDATELAEQVAGRRLSPGEVSAYWTRRALDYVVSQPADWLRLMLRKLALFLSSIELVDSEDQYATAEYSHVLRATGVFGHFGVLAPLALLGAIVLWPRRRELWWMYLAAAAYAASVLLFYVMTRYRYPLVPFLALAAGAGLIGAKDWAAARSRPVVAGAAAAVLALALVSNGVAGMSKASMGAVTHFNLGAFFERDGQLERALPHYRKALDLDPHLEDVANNLARTLLALGRPEQAIAAYQAQLRRVPDDPTLHANLAKILRARGDRVQAGVHYRRALALDPGYTEARHELSGLALELATRLVERGDEAAALEHYREALALRPDTPAALWAGAWILATHPDAGLRRPAEAVALAERAARLGARRTPSTLETSAAAYAAAGRFEEALAAAREAAALQAAAGQPASTRLAEARSRYERGEPYVRPPRGAAEPR